MRTPARLARLPLAGVLSAILAGGCAVPSWVPFIGKDETPPAGSPVGPVKPALAPVLGTVTGPGGDDVLDRVICIVNNDAITLFELEEAEAYYLYERKERPPEGDARDALRRQLLDRIIENRLQLQQAQTEKLTVEDAEIAEQFAEVMKKVGAGSEADLDAILKKQGVTLETVKKRIREQMLVQKLIRRRVALRVSVTEEDVDRYLEENRDKLETGLTFVARHIFFAPAAGRGEEGWKDARARAEAAWGRIQAGADFAEVAREVSDDPTGKSGGELGTLRRGELATEIEAAILALAPGEVSRPVRSGVGVHLFRLDSREALQGDALTQARNQIREILYREKYQARLREWVREVRERAMIETRL
jgi:peptidyl-prolyl cis-trans isomerase SurA